MRPAGGKREKWVVVKGDNNNERLLPLMKSKLGGTVLDASLERGDVVVRIERQQLLTFGSLLKLDAELSFNLLLDITAVDWLDTRPERFELVYHLLSLKHQHRLRIKVAVPECDSRLDSVTALWSSADFLEREVWDMFGVTFGNHPDLRRILLYEEFKGHPLRKDYPVQGKQPRIRMRHPEVRNTAMDMERPPLAQLKRKRPRSERLESNDGGDASETEGSASQASRDTSPG